jgi:hypothetical protein
MRLLISCRYVALSKDLLTSARAVASSEEWKPWLQVHQKHCCSKERNSETVPQRVGWFVALATDRQEHSYGGGGVHSRIQHWMQAHWHMHVSKAASAVALGVPIGNVMGLHCLLQSQATVTLHMEKRAKDLGGSSTEQAIASSATSAPVLNGGVAAGDMLEQMIIIITIIFFVAASVNLMQTLSMIAGTRRPCPGSRAFWHMQRLCAWAHRCSRLSNCCVRTPCTRSMQRRQSTFLLFCRCPHRVMSDDLQVFGSKKNGDMAMVVLRKGLVQGKQTNLQIVQTIVGTVLDKGFGGGDCLFSGANIEGGGMAAAVAAAGAKLPGGSGGAPEVMEWAEFLGWGWSAALRAGDALELLQVMIVSTMLMMTICPLLLLTSRRLMEII